VDLLREHFSKIDLTFEYNEKIRDIYWYGIYDKDDICVSTMLCYNIVFDIFRHIVYKYKLRKVLPKFGDVYIQLKFALKCLCTANKKFSAALGKVEQLAIFSRAMG
jgi:hypothetical protein